MALPRAQSVAVGLALVGVTWGVYGQVVPNVSDLRVARPNDANATAAEKAARWTSGAIVVGVALLTQDATVFIIGGMSVVAFSWLHRHANAVNPTAAMASTPGARNVMTYSDGSPVGSSPSN